MFGKFHIRVTYTFLHQALTLWAECERVCELYKRSAQVHGCGEAHALEFVSLRQHDIHRSPQCNSSSAVSTTR